MLRFILGRVLWIVPVLFMIAVITFGVMHATPGSPLLPSSGSGNLNFSEAAMKNLEALYGLDKPLHEQFGLFLWNAVHGDFGLSYRDRNREVKDILAAAIPKSFHLGIMAMAIAVMGGLTLGVLAAMHQNKWMDYVLAFFSMIGVAIPSFVLALLLILAFSIVIPIFRTGGWDEPKDWVLPAVALGLMPMGIIARYTRSCVVEAIRSDYVMTARAKGLTERRVVAIHVLKNALIPVLTVMGPMFASVTTGSFFIESMFRIPGFGMRMTMAMQDRDYPMIMASTLIVGGFVSIANLTVDLLYGVVDPRVRYGGGAR